MLSSNTRGTKRHVTAHATRTALPARRGDQRQLWQRQHQHYVSRARAFQSVTTSPVVTPDAFMR